MVRQRTGRSEEIGSESIEGGQALTFQENARIKVFLKSIRSHITAHEAAFYS